MNKFPRAAATPRPVVNKLIHGVIHSLKCSQPLFIPPIYVCCYFSESAERNHAREEINHISPHLIYGGEQELYEHISIPVNTTGERRPRVTREGSPASFSINPRLEEDD